MQSDVIEKYGDREGLEMISLEEKVHVSYSLAARRVTSSIEKWPVSTAAIARAVSRAVTTAVATAATRVPVVVATHGV